MRAKCLGAIWASLLAWFLLTSAVLDGEAQVFLFEWGEPGNADGQFSEPSGIAIDSSGNIYVADSLNHRIQKFDDQGAFILKWGSAGSGIGQFIFPQAKAIALVGDYPETVSVSDATNRIQRFNTDPGLCPGQITVSLKKAGTHANLWATRLATSGN